MPIADLAPILERVQVEPGGCWLWTGPTTPAGYGRTRFQGHLEYAHRWFYRITFGAIPAGHVLDHLCRRPNCVRPDHLEPVSQRTNTLRGIGPSAVRSEATHCVNGHPFDDANTYWRKDGHGLRECRACRAGRMRCRRVAGPEGS